MQKWILREAWKRLNSQHPQLRMDEIYIGFFKVPKKITTWENIGTDGKPIPCSWESYVWPNSKKVILCNSLRRLREKDLIKIEKTDFRHYQKRRAISLTETGEQKGLMLIQEAKC